MKSIKTGDRSRRLFCDNAQKRYHAFREHDRKDSGTYPLEFIKKASVHGYLFLYNLAKWQYYNG